RAAAAAAFDLAVDDAARALVTVWSEKLEGPSSCRDAAIAPATAAQLPSAAALNRDTHIVGAPAPRIGVPGSGTPAIRNRVESEVSGRRDFGLLPMAPIGGPQPVGSRSVTRRTTNANR